MTVTERVAPKWEFRRVHARYSRTIQEKFKFAKPWTDPDGRLALSPPQMDKLQGYVELAMR